MRKSLPVLLVLCLLAGLALNLYASGQQKERELRTETVKMKYIKAKQAWDILKGYETGYGRITWNDELNILTIRELPEVVDKMLSIIKEIDSKPADLMFTVDLILGSMTPEAVPKSIKSSLDIPDKGLESDPVIRELKKVLGYKYYSKIDTAFIRVQDGGQSQQMIGGPGFDFRLELNPDFVKDEKEDSIQLRRLHLGRYVWSQGKRQYSGLIETPLSLKIGERTVVGVSKLDGGENALILIISGKAIK